MAKEYFQDIIPPDENPSRPPRPAPAPAASSEPLEQESLEGPASERSIRNIAPERPMRAQRPAVNDSRDPGNFGVQQLPPKPKRRRTSARAWLWVLAILVVVVLGGLSLFAFRKTTVTVTPRSHVIAFDQTSQFTAYPALSAATGTLGYAVVSSTLEASQTVPAEGTQNAQTKAEGMILVYNDYSTAPVDLIANTRFETPSGLIFRTPTAITIPGKSGDTPGHVSIQVVADQPGAQYNIGPVSRFTVPGLQSTPAMYANIYAQSTASTTGGFVGEEPVADPTALANAQSQLQSQLAQEAQSAASAENSSSTIVLPALIQVTYQNSPQTAAPDGSVSVNESAQIETPEFDAQSFAQAIGQSVSADTAGALLTFVPGPDFAVQGLGEASSTLGTDPITFSLSGTATLVWQVDAQALAEALAGHDQAAFPTIESSFPGVQAAHARIEPFWSSSFPSNPADIQVVIEPPATSSPQSGA